MHYSVDYLQDVLPEQDPPSEFIPGAVHEEISGWLERGEIEDRELVARSTRWTYALFSEVSLYQYRVSITDRPILPLLHPRSWLNALSIGLFDPEFEFRAFGFIIHVPATEYELPREIAAAWFDFPRLKKSFPVIFREVAYDEHALAHPMHATSASWAQCDLTGAWGVLTAGHIAPGARPGTRIPLACGNRGVLGRSYHPPLDAAFVQTAPPDKPPSQIPIRRFPAAGQPVVGVLKTLREPRTVVHVDSFMQVVNTWAYPVQLFLDKPFKPGDSGALIQTTSGEAVGLYLGSVQSPVVKGLEAGRALNFEQAVLALEVTPYL